MAEHTPTPWEVYGASIRTVAAQEPRYVMELNSVRSANLATDGILGSLSSPRGAEQRDIDAAFIVKAVNLHDELVGALRFILAFYEPGQTHLDTEAWKRAEAGARRALTKAEA